MNELYLSIGSNIGKRINFIDEALILIQKQVGQLTKKAAIYETPPWGFESSPFLNTCICVTTELTTQEALLKFQSIEKELGRKTKTSSSYAARPIDIDIIYSSEGVINLPHLTVPHPLMQARKFVLIPLLDIASEYIHPLLHKNTKQLLVDCTDGSEIKMVETDS